MSLFWKNMLIRYKSRKLGIVGLAILLLFFLVALYAPFLASSKPIVVVYDGELYFPLFRYLFSTYYFSKKIDIFFNLLGVLFLPFIASLFLKSAYRMKLQILLLFLLISGFVYFGFCCVLDPASSLHLNQQKESAILRITSEKEVDAFSRPRYILPSWQFELDFMTPYAKLDLVLNEMNLRRQYEKLKKILGKDAKPYTLYSIMQEHTEQQAAALKKEIEDGRALYEKTKKEEEELRRGRNLAVHEKLYLLEEQNEAYEELVNRLQYIQDKRQWLKAEAGRVSFILMPLIRPYGWEDDVGGDMAQNAKLPVFQASRINGKDLMAALIFGSRISLFVGFAATALALIIGIPLGLISGYFGGRIDILLCRFVEVWEAMPVFFMLLLVVTIMQTKSIFVVIAVLSVFSWEGAFRFVRAETFKQRELLYVDASRALGFPNSRILLRHILPNSTLAVLALLPFSIMGAITSEAGLAFLGIGEELSCSWGVLMDEGRSAFPAVSSLLWPPALVLTLLLIAIAFVGEALQAAMDPKSEEG